MQNKKRREELFLLLCLAAAGVCAVLAFRFAVPLQAQTPQTLPDTKELAAYTQVELNTADADTFFLQLRRFGQQWWIHGQGRRMSARV